MKAHAAKIIPPPMPNGASANPVTKNPAQLGHDLRVKE